MHWRIDIQRDVDSVNNVQSHSTNNPAKPHAEVQERTKARVRMKELMGVLLSGFGARWILRIGRSTVWTGSSIPRFSFSLRKVRDSYRKDVVRPEMHIV